MPGSDELCVVSVQKPGVVDPEQAHLGPALLVGPTLLLVAAETLLAASPRFDVLIGPAPGGSGPVERHAAHPFPDGRVSIARLAGQEKRVALGHAQLIDGRSGYPGRDAQLDRLLGALEKLAALPTRQRTARLKPGGPWGLLSPMVPDEIRELPDAEWFADLRDRIAPPLPPVDLVVPWADFGRWICRFSPLCDPPGGKRVGAGGLGKVAPPRTG